MIPATLDLTIKRGDTFRQFFRLRNKDANGDPSTYPDLTSWGAGLSQIRANADSDTVVATMTITKANQVTYPGGILLTLSAATTASIPAGNYVWDFEIANDLGETDTYLDGAVTVTKDVSRAP